MKELSIKEYNELVDDQIKLRALEAAGVDNWNGYDTAMDILEEWAEEDEETKHTIMSENLEK